MNDLLKLDASTRVDEVSCMLYEQLCEHPAILGDPRFSRVAEQAFSALSKLARELSMVSLPAGE